MKFQRPYLLTIITMLFFFSSYAQSNRSSDMISGTEQKSKVALIKESSETKMYSNERIKEKLLLDSKYNYETFTSHPVSTEHNKTMTTTRVRKTTVNKNNQEARSITKDSSNNKKPLSKPSKVVAHKSPPKEAKKSLVLPSKPAPMKKIDQ